MMKQYLIIDYSELNGSKYDNIQVIFSDLQEFPSANW